MTSKTACELVLIKYPELKVMKCQEYESRFVFTVVPKDFDESKDVSKILNSQVAVIKATNEVKDFKPFHISREEYAEGKEVTDYK